MKLKEDIGSTDELERKKSNMSVHLEKKISSPHDRPSLTLLSDQSEIANEFEEASPMSRKKATREQLQAKQNLGDEDMYSPERLSSPRDSTSRLAIYTRLDGIPIA